MTEHSWHKHNQQTIEQKLPPSVPLSTTLKYIHSINNNFRAADLGCGAGTDTIALLNKGFQVLAIDKDQASLDLLQEKVNHENLTVSQQAFESLELPQLDLINASMALPFCAPDHFDNCWHYIVNALDPTGYFCGHFFGQQDSWINRTGMTFLSKQDIDKLFQEFNILWLDETEKDGKTLNGMPKHWHVFSIVAQKLK